MTNASLRLVGGRDVVARRKAAPAEADVHRQIAELAAASEAGEVIGIAYVVMYRGRHFVVNTAGELHRNPTFARGAVAALDDELRQMVWGER